MLAGIALAQYLHSGQVSDAIVGGLVTLVLTALGRVVDLRKADDEDDDA